MIKRASQLWSVTFTYIKLVFSNGYQKQLFVQHKERKPFRNADDSVKLGTVCLKKHRARQIGQLIIIGESIFTVFASLA